MPDNAIYVSPAGSDAAAGTKAAPLRSLAQAIRRAPNGSTIVLRAGSYNESTTVPSDKTLTIEAYPGEVVWLDGSTSVSSWAHDGSVWVHDGWTAQFDSSPSYTSGQVGHFVDPNYPMAAHPDQVWLDGNSLTQVGSRSAVRPGTFYADYNADQLVIGDDPAGRSVRASDAGIALTVRSPGTVLRGFGVRRYATSVPDLAAVRMGGAGDVMTDVISQENATTGVAALAANVHVSNVTVAQNGMLGMLANYADGLTVDAIYSTGNNAEHFNQAPVSGGLKITRSRGLTVRDSIFTKNFGPGLWFDESCYNALVVGNEMTDNVGHGMSYEISSTALLYNNLIVNNGGIGLKINNSDHVHVWNATLGNNASNVRIVEDSRRGADLSDPGHDPRQKLPDPTEPWITFGDSVMNSVIQPARSGTFGVYANDTTGEYSNAQLGTNVDGNLFVRPSNGVEIGWGTGDGRYTSYNTTASFTSGTGLGRSNTEIANAASATNNQIVAATGVPLPADVANAVGAEAGSTVVGAG